MKPWMLAVRSVAFVIAIVAVIDPSVAAARTSKPLIALVGPDGVDRASVTAALSKNFTVIDGPFANAAGTVIIGGAVPAGANEMASPVFVVAADGGRPSLAIANVLVPVRSSLDARTPVTATVRAQGARGRAVDVTLSVGGVIVDRLKRTIASDDEAVAVPLSFAATTAGPVRLHVSASIGADSSAADVATTVGDARWPVLFFDRRPSWMSTFVRRALEADRRFVVGSRTITSRDISIDAGHPASSLADPTLLELYDVIVVGNPNLLTAADVQGLEAFLRKKGGGVAFLYDEAERTASAAEGLTRAARWSAASSDAAVAVASLVDSTSLRAGELAWPTTLPAAATAIAVSGASRAIVWKAPVGAGTVVVSGALDAWRFRDTTESGFDRFWRSTVAALAANARPALDVRVDPAIATPNQRVTVAVVDRDAMLAGAPTSRTPLSGRALDPNGSATPFTLWPSGSGEYVGTVRAAGDRGVARIEVTNGSTTAAASIVVDTDVHPVQPDDRDVLAGFAKSHGGAVVAAGDLTGALRKATHGTSSSEVWHPMREWWWIVVFVTLLGAEWTARRRAGLA